MWKTSSGISFPEVESEHAARWIAPWLSIRRALVTRRRQFERFEVSRICLICTRLYLLRGERPAPPLADTTLRVP
ncbi:hypothetical protein [Burkholderia pyrrocinia]|uniref:hypothetical protein n=1 Tax=Burkholderia pyrrocinia TaxID=60550 RepID=UPI000ADF1712|nr:hypothetical protein [Burkholderia pyrrocinia]